MGLLKCVTKFVYYFKQCSECGFFSNKVLVYELNEQTNSNFTYLGSKNALVLQTTISVKSIILYRL